MYLVKLLQLPSKIFIWQNCCFIHNKISFLRAFVSVTISNFILIIFHIWSYFWLKKWPLITSFFTAWNIVLRTSTQRLYGFSRKNQLIFFEFSLAFVFVFVDV